MPPPGRPSSDRPTRQVRLADDLVEKLVWIADIEDRSISDFVDPLLRPAVEAAYAKIRATVLKIQAARDERRALQAADLGESGA